METHIFMGTSYCLFYTYYINLYLLIIYYTYLYLIKYCVFYNYALNPGNQNINSLLTNIKFGCAPSKNMSTSKFELLSILIGAWAAQFVPQTLRTEQ